MEVDAQRTCRRVQELLILPEVILFYKFKILKAHFKAMKEGKNHTNSKKVSIKSYKQK